MHLQLQQVQCRMLRNLARSPPNCVKVLMCASCDAVVCAAVRFEVRLRMA